MNEPPRWPERSEAEELGRIVVASVREAWQTYALQFQDEAPPAPASLDAVLARAAYPILASLEALPREAGPRVFESVVRLMLGATIEVTRGALAREHQRMLDTLEREATRFAERAASAVDAAHRARAQEVRRLGAEVKRLREQLARRS